MSLKPPPAMPPKSQQIKKEKPFNFEYIKVILNDKSGGDKGKKEVLLPRSWIEATNAVPHFTKVIRNVNSSEGIEITMNCNTQAFEWIIEVTKIKCGYVEGIFKNIPQEERTSAI